MTKADIDGFLTNVFKSNKHFIGNLYKGNEKCIQGDLYLEIIKSGIDVYLEFPSQSRCHLDIAEFDHKNSVCPFIIETKHSTPHFRLNNFVRSSYNCLYQDLQKRKLPGVQDIFLVLIVTEIISHNNSFTYPFIKTYLKYHNSQKADENSKQITLLERTLRQNIDPNLINKFVPRNINGVDMKLHYFILQPAISNINNIPAWSDISLNLASN